MFYGNMTAVAESRKVCGSIAKYLQECPRAAERCKAVFETAEELIKTYKKILTPSEISRARALCWGRESVEEYIRMFRSNVLMNYKVWEITPEKFCRIYNFIKKENPEWAKVFMRDYESKLRRCKRTIQKIAV